MANCCDANFEKDSVGALRNSRSVILIPLPGKLMKSIMKIRISGHLDKNVLFEKNQHDFCEKKK